MERVEVNVGGVIEAYRYDELNGLLEIQFSDGRRAVHEGVSVKTYQAFAKSDRPAAAWAVLIMRRGHKDGKPAHATRWIEA